LLPSRPAKDFHLQSSAHARHTRSGYALPSSPPRRRLIAVGTPVAERPPHRSTRAAFPHVAPTLGG
jgi:hypothetical protein